MFAWHYSKYWECISGTEQTNFLPFYNINVILYNIILKSGNTKSSSEALCMYVGLVYQSFPLGGWFCQFLPRGGKGGRYPWLRKRERRGRRGRVGPERCEHPTPAPYCTPTLVCAFCPWIVGLSGSISPKGKSLVTIWDDCLAALAWEQGLGFYFLSK